MKRLVSLILCAAMIMGMNVHVLAINDDTAAHEAQLAMIDAYNQLCEKYDQDGDKAMEELLATYPNLEIVDSSVTYFDDEGKEVVMGRSSDNDISFVQDSLVYDNDWGTYVYFGQWEWKTAPDELYLSPDDMVGFYTQDPTTMYPLEYFVYGYNDEGVRRAYYNSQQIDKAEGITKGSDTVWGADFWIDELYVRNGRMIVPIEYVAGSTAKVMMQYSHSWTETEITDVTGSAVIGASGIQVTWSTGVKSWGHIVSSGGVRLPS